MRKIHLPYTLIAFLFFLILVQCKTTEDSPLVKEQLEKELEKEKQFNTIYEGKKRLHWEKQTKVTKKRMKKTKKKADKYNDSKKKRTQKY